MKCSNCGNEMITSRTGWLCVSCGHAELARPAEEVTAQIIRERPRGRIQEPPALSDETSQVSVPGNTAPAPVISSHATQAHAQPVLSPQLAAAVAAAPTPQAAPVAVAPVAIAAPVPAPSAASPVAAPAAAPTAAPAAPAPAPAVSAPAPAEPEAPSTDMDAVISEISAAMAAQTHRKLPPVPVATVAAVTPAAPAATAAPAPAPAHAAAPAPDPQSVPPRSAELVPHTALSSSPAVAAALAGTAPAAAPAPTPPATPAPAAPPAPIAIKPPVEPKTDPKPAVLTDTKPAPQPEQAKPQPEPTKPQPTPAKPAAPTPDAPAKQPPASPSDSPKPAAAAKPEAQTVPAATPAKAPLQPITHPKTMSLRRRILSWAGIVVGVLILMVIAFSVGSGQNPLQFLHRTSSAAPPSPVAAGAQPSAAVLGATVAYDPREGDSQRRQDIAAYAAAYMPLQKKGLYPVKPPTIQLALIDPASHQPYRVSVNPPAAPGELQYWLGGSCDGPAQKPARSGSKTLALRLYLEASSTPACIQVR